MRSSDTQRTSLRRRLRRTETEAERKLWLRLRDRRLGGFKFVRQESIGAYVADLACREAKLIVEADGSQHAESARDAVRDAWLKGQGHRILRFWNHEIMNTPDAVIDTILAALPPSPRGGGEDARHPVVSGVSPQGEGEGVSTIVPRSAPPPHPRLPPRFVDDEVDEALSPRAGRGGAHT